MEIPLTGGSANAHQRLTVQAGDAFLQLELNYISSGQWAVDISREGTLLAAGLMLEPNSNLLELYDLDIGSLIFVGEETTLDNLGRLK